MVVDLGDILKWGGCKQYDMMYTMFFPFMQITLLIRFN